MTSIVRGMTAIWEPSGPWMRETYSVTITWHPKPGETASVSSGHEETEAKAFEAALGMAERLGYTPPRWWQWWRYGENRDFAFPERPGPGTGAQR